MSQILHISIPTPAGYLEGLLKPEEDGVVPRYASIVCHPHPLRGGTMHNKVVYKVADALQIMGIPALRFNFRGVGNSTGTYDEGRGEMDDVRYALGFLNQSYPAMPVILSGFSFGADVGLRVAAVEDRVQAMIGLGTPPRLFNDKYLHESQKHKLFIHGTRDELVLYAMLVSGLERVADPKMMASIEGADHFFRGRLDEVQAAITDFVRSLQV